MGSLEWMSEGMNDCKTDIYIMHLIAIFIVQKKSAEQ